MPLPECYLSVLRQRGRSLQEIGVNGIALEETDALEAVQALRGSRVAILGGDVYKLVNGIPELSYDNWFCEKAEGEPEEDYLTRSWKVAAKYIGDYSKAGDNKILFLLVLSED